MGVGGLMDWVGLGPGWGGEGNACMEGPRLAHLGVGSLTVRGEGWSKWRGVWEVVGSVGVGCGGGMDGGEECGK